MSESSSGIDVRQHCLSVVLLRCIAKDEDLTKELANILREEDVVKKDIKIKWINLARNHEAETAIKEMMEYIAASDGGNSKLPEYLRLCEAPENVCVLVSMLTREEETPAIILTLIKKWDILVQREEDLKREASRFFPENAGKIVNDLPISFINFCADQTSQQMQGLLREVAPIDFSQDEPGPSQTSYGPSFQEQSDQAEQCQDGGSAESGQYSLQVITTEEVQQARQAESERNDPSNGKESDIEKLEEYETDSRSDDEDYATPDEGPDEGEDDCEEDSSNQLQTEVHSHLTEKETSDKEYKPENYQLHPAKEPLNLDSDAIADSAHSSFTPSSANESPGGPPETEPSEVEPPAKSQANVVATVSREEGNDTITSEAKQAVTTSEQTSANTSLNTTPSKMPTSPQGQPPTPRKRRFKSSAAVKMTTAETPTAPTVDDTAQKFHMEPHYQRAESPTAQIQEVQSSYTAPTAEEDAAAQFLLSNYAELEEFKELLIPIAALAWPHKQIQDWSADLCDLVSTKDDWSAMHFIAACNFLFQRKEILKNYKSRATHNVVKWIITSTKLLAQPENSNIMLMLYEMTWKELPEQREAIKWPLLLRKKLKNDGKRTADFIQVVAMFFELMEKSSDIPVPATITVPTHMEAERDAAKSAKPQTATGLDPTTGTGNPPYMTVPSPPPCLSMHEETEIEHFTRSRSRKNAQLQQGTKVGSEAHPISDVQVEADVPTTTTPQQSTQEERHKQKRSETSASEVGKSQQEAGGVTTRQQTVSKKSEKESSTPGTQSENEPEPASEATENDGRGPPQPHISNTSVLGRGVDETKVPTIVLRVAVIGMGNESMCFAEDGVHISTEMEKHGNGIFTISLPYKTCLKYNYFTFCGIFGRFTKENAHGVRIVYFTEASGASFVYDEAVFHYQNNVIGQSMHLHLPRKPDLLKTEVRGWINQMLRGWRFLDHRPTVYAAKETITKSLDDWLKSFHEDDSVPAALALVMAVSDCHYFAEPCLVNRILRCMDMTTKNAITQQRIFQNVAMLTDVTGHSTNRFKRLENSMINFFQKSCELSPNWLLAVPLFYLVQQEGHVPRTNADDVYKRAFYPCRAGVLINQSLKWVLTSLGGKKSAANYQERLRNLSKNVMEISNVHPWIVHLYHCLLANYSIKKLILDGDKILQIFQMDLFAENVLPSIETSFASKSEKNSAYQEKVEELFVAVFMRPGDRDVVSFTEEEVTQAVPVMNNVLKTIIRFMKNTNKQNFTTFCIRIAFWVSSWSHKTISKNPTNKNGLIEETMNEVLEAVLTKIDASCFKNVSKVNLKFFDDMLRIGWPQEFGDTWKRTIQCKICASVDKKWQNEHEKYLEFFDEKIMSVEEPWSRDLAYCFEDKAVRCAQALLEHDRNSERKLIMCVFSWPTSKKYSAIAGFFEKFFLVEFKKYHQPEVDSQMRQILKFVCEWPLATKFFQTFNNDSALKHLPKVKPIFEQIEESCWDFISLVQTRQVRADDLNLIRNHREKICHFLEICAQKSPAGSSADSLRKIIDNLFDRMERFKKEQQQARVFMDRCTKLQDYGIKVDFTNLERLYGGKNDSSELSNFSTIEDIASKAPGKPELTNDHMKEFMLLETLRKSEIFNRTWKAQARNYKTKHALKREISIHWEEVLTEIWENVKKIVTDLTWKILAGQMDFNTTVENFEFTEGDRGKIAKEVKRLFQFTQRLHEQPDDEQGLPESVVTTVDQICLVFEVKKDVRGLRWVTDFKEQFKLEGDFAILNNLSDITSSEMALHEIAENIKKGYPVRLKVMTQAELDDLQTFLDKTELITWLKNTKMTDVAEIKVLYDLVTSSAAENPQEADRVMYLMNAAQGFAPLLFHLDEINSLEDLMQRCSEVAKNIKGDSKIVQKWKDSAGHLQWFTEKERLYGSDQKLCLRRAQEINENGVYTIGNIGPPGSHTRNPTLDNSISLRVQVKYPNPSTYKRADEQAESYTLNELQDLQSRLMLIAGEEDQGQQDIQQFIDLFTTVKTVAEAYVYLVDAGCMLFSEWTAVVGPGPSRRTGKQMEQNLWLTIRFMKNSKPLSGTVGLGSLQDLSRALRQAYEQWAAYIASKRLEHYYLNEYSIQQITYLCHELAIAENTASLPDQVLALLSKNSKCVISGAIQDALDEAIKINDEQENVANPESSFTVEEESKMTDLEKKKRAIRILVNRERLNEELAKAAVQAVGHEDTDECNNWALLYQFDKTLVKTKLEEYEEQNACVLQSNEEEELTTILENRSVRSLTGMIDQILGTKQIDDSLPIVGAVKTICHQYYLRTSILTLQDYLSIEHLGRFLTILHENHEVKTPVNRSLVEPMELGKPNLIICPEQDTLTTLLSLYMEDQHQPLPTTSEVLLCDEATSSDDVERFMRRAMCKCQTNGRPIFCLAYTDKLKFNVSQAIENIHNELKTKTKHINEEYQLVLITSKADHYISGCFEKHKIPRRRTNYDPSEMSSYLKTHLQATHGCSDGNGNSLVKLVTSNRSGVGKSLFVNKLKNKLDPIWYEKDDQMNEFLQALSKADGDTTRLRRNLPEKLVAGQPNFILCPQDAAVLPTLLALYMHTPTEPPPLASEVLLCSWRTTEDDLETFMRRAICLQTHESHPIFVMAFYDQLTPVMTEKVLQIYDKLSMNAHARKDYRLVILSSKPQKYSGFKRFQVVSGAALDQVGVSAYLAQHEMSEGSALEFEEYSEPRNGNKEEQIVDSSDESHEDSAVSQSMKQKPAAIFSTPPQTPASQWHKTTIRLLEKDINTNHVLKRLYGGGVACSASEGIDKGHPDTDSHPKQDNQRQQFHMNGESKNPVRNEDKHFIHFDLTPAVENNVELFMFNLLVLGSIQDKNGRVWNRQPQHLYVIEMTKRTADKVQEAKKKDVQSQKISILNLLPCVRCLSPLDTLDKYRQVKKKTAEILRQDMETTDQSDDYISGVSKYLDERHLHQIHDFYQREEHSSEDGSRVRAVLQMIGFPNFAVRKITSNLSDDANHEVEDIYEQQDLANFQLMDFDEFISTKFQRPYQYLKHADMKDVDLDEFQYSRPMGTPADCIEVLQNAYGARNPSWAQLRHFASFLNFQLKNCEESVFCQRIEQTERSKDKKKIKKISWEHTELKGLKDFAVNFMIRMAQDFATPSLVISDQSRKDIDQEEQQIDDQNILESHQVRRKWEEKCHPYVFFNEDRASMSFINVNFNRNGDLLNEKDQVMVPKIAKRRLVQGLRSQGIKFGFNFEKLSREDKLNKLCTIMGLPPYVHPYDDPDPNYELTTENVLKILAIYMRLRCNIPVIVMGETGCGKTRMVEFMSKLRARGDATVKNMVTLKIHGGVSAENIYDSVRKAKAIAGENRSKGMGTVLFYDEANTTTAIHAIKEVICDGTIDGESFHDSQLQIVAACNPYKCLTEKAIKKLENLGLGYRVAASETASLGSIPMRRLVYKVVALPPSMQPFVWDFGQLTLPAERRYISQMTVHLQKALKLEKAEKFLIDFLFFQAQSYIKKMKDECRYVSLRDVERCMKFFTFFHQQLPALNPKIEKELKRVYGKEAPPEINDTLRCLLQTLGVCYHVSLDNRKAFREHISEQLEIVEFHLSESDINEEMIACQKVFLANLRIANNIALNEALRENVYLITICMELRIPLFLVGKPGSSKSLAKTIVADNMEGTRSKSPLYRRMKQVHMVSYQCSALTDADGIQSIFKKASDFQNGRDLEVFTSVVVLDEIGLAEDSPNMPLKILHPLLECGSTVSGTIADVKATDKVGFVGISNWALDPAKMNRGIFVSRSTPSEVDLLDTARAIVRTDDHLMDDENDILERLTTTYLDIYNNQRLTGTKEYFGLRDYYSLIKMVNAKSMSKEKCELQDVAHAVQRNFSGGQRQHHEDFVTAVKEAYYSNENLKTASVQEMIRENLNEKDTRFLLLLTGRHSNVALLEHIIEDFQKHVYVIYGSSFPGDHTYTEICKNINRIKVCMETGRKVVLLNLTQVHESLYDALNQHYSVYGGQRYVDIGLGGHRLKCRVADKFRLIVLEQKDVVYREYPIPLINRLEKHHLVSSSLLTNSQQLLSNELRSWTTTFSHTGNFREKDAFVGLHEDTVCSVVISQEQPSTFETCWKVMLQSAAADAVFRSHKNPRITDKEYMLETYTDEQVHDNLSSLLERYSLHYPGALSVLEVTSFSNILTETHRKRLADALALRENCITLLSLQQFDTQQEYVIRLEKFFSAVETTATEETRILLIQCPQAQQHGSLLACAKYCLMNLLRKVKQKPNKTIIVAFLHSTRRQHANNTDEQLVLQHTRSSAIIYVDDLRPADEGNPLLSHFYGKSIADVLQMSAEEISQGSGTPRIDFLGMLKDTILQAMTVVKRNERTGSRNIDCVDFLTRMCKQQEWIARGFSKNLVRRLADIYREKEQESPTSKFSWIVNESLSAEKLQEGDTFGNTLCLCLKRHLASLLAFIVSASDENNNLNFLFEKNLKGESSWQPNVWLQFFAVFRLEWNQMRGVQEFPVKFAPHLQEDFSPQLPFSFELNNLLMNHWLAVKEEEQGSKILFKQFRESPFAVIIGQASEINGPEITQAYAADVIRSVPSFGNLTSQDYEALTNILLVMAKKLKGNLTESGEFDPKDSITIVFFTYQELSRHLHMLSKIFTVHPGISLKAAEWIEKQSKADNFKIHSLAMIDLLDFVVAAKIDDDTSCVAWMELTENCKKIFHPYEQLIEASDNKQDIIERWEPISLLDLLLLRLLPSNGPQDQSFTNYVKVVVSHARRLLSPLKKFGFRDRKFLRIVLNVLRKSYEDIQLKLLLSWQDLSCKMCRKAFEDPVELPCHHFICKECVDRMFVSADIRRQCPLCPQPIPQDFKRKPAVLSPSGEKDAAAFKANCTSFFLEYLALFCFSDTMPEMQDQVYLFLHELVIGIPLPENDRMELELETIDLNITTRSNILQLLIQNDAVMVENRINELLLNGALNAEQKENLIIVIFSTFEMTIQKKTYQWEEFQNAWTKIGNSAEVTVEVLSLIATLRNSLQRCILSTKKKSNVSPEVFAILQSCESDETETLKKYMVKLGCQIFGTGWFDFVSNHKHMKEIIPEEMKKSDNTKPIDHWLMLGDSYIQMRQMLNTTRYDEFKERMPTLFGKDESSREALPKILAIANFANSRYFEWLCEYMNEAHVDMKNMFSIINMFKDVKISNLPRSQGSAIVQLLILSNCITVIEPYMMEEYFHLLEDPIDAAKRFWPGMPVSMFFSVRDILATETSIAAYKCPNGHPYVIGECTRPYYTGECPECHETIGGTRHVPARGNEKIEHTEEAELGYQLTSDRVGKDDPCDRMSKQGVAVVHFILHSCLLVALKRDATAVTQILKQGSVEDAEKYLYDKLHDNIGDLSDALGRNYDDALITMNACLGNILENGLGIAGTPQNWRSMANRVAWEDAFRKRYLLPIFRDINNVVRAAHQTINKVEDLQNMMLYRLTHEITTEEEPDKLTWNHPVLWRTVKQSNAAHLLQAIRDFASTGGVLKTILESPELHLLRNLGNVLRLQRALITKYQNQKDLEEVEKIEFEHYKDEHYKDRHLVDEYIKLWNSLCDIFGKNANKQIQDYLHPIDDNSPVTMALPSTRGRGRCAKLLTEYLIDIHNQFLDNCSQEIKPMPSTREVDVSQLGLSDYILIDKQKDLLGMIRMHTSYTITKDDNGTHHHINYDLNALEKKVREKYVIYKPRIKKKTLPCIKYPQDIGIGSDWNKVKSNIPQEPLSEEIIQDIDATVANQGITPADVCEGVRTVTHAISFLAKIKTDERRTLQRYLEDDLLLSPNHMVMIPKAALICHTLGVYQRLMWHKAVNFVQQGLNPYKEALYKVEQCDIEDVAVLTKLKEAFERMEMATFQQRLNEMLIQVPDFNPDWSLTELIFPNLEFIEDDHSDGWCERIPAEICFKHVSHLFQLSVKGIDVSNAQDNEV